jgi:SAM-dependent methyltransferase
MTPRASDAGSYVGTELELFRHARNWKRYFARQIAPHLGSRVLEVGAGMGGTTAVLCDGTAESWTCLEPDPRLLEEIEARRTAGDLPECCTGLGGTLGSLDPASRYDAILYVDVLEHIEDDRGELRAASGFLAPGGRLIVLSPAHQWLFSPFDESIGHHRRYSRSSLEAVVPRELERVCLRYLDSVGVMASGANRALMKQGMPTPGQLRFWDRVLVPLSRMVDPLTFYRVGKSVLGVWQRGKG